MLERKAAKLAGTRFLKPELLCELAASTFKADMERDKERIRSYWKGLPEIRLTHISWGLSAPLV